MVDAREQSTVPGLATIAAVMVLAAVLGGAVIVAPDRPSGSGTRLLPPAAEVLAEMPDTLRTAELYAAEPGAESLRALFDALGGFNGLTISVATGAFDLVEFDPLDADRLLATNRRSYGAAENQRTNEVWVVEDGTVRQQLWAPDVPHDYAHFNGDGSITRWVHGGGDGFAPRIAQLLGRDQAPLGSTSPMYASRTVASASRVFALTGSDDYYSSASGYEELVVDDGSGRRVLAPAERFARIDLPTHELLVAFPESPRELTAAWDAETLAPLSDHPLAGRSHRGAAVSGDGEVAVAVTSSGRIEIIDLRAGLAVDQFGAGLDTRSVAAPIAVNGDGTVAITVERDGVVTLWWVGVDEPIAAVAAGSGQSRWVSESRAPRTTSAVADDAGRVALYVPAQGRTPTTWHIVDTDIDSWVQRACERAGRSLTRAEAEALGIDRWQAVC